MIYRTTTLTRAAFVGNIRDIEGTDFPLPPALPSL